MESSKEVEVLTSKDNAFLRIRFWIFIMGTFTAIVGAANYGGFWLAFMIFGILTALMAIHD